MGERDRARARHLDIEDWLQRQCDVLPAGAGLPTEVDVAQRFDVSRMTARQAFQRLVQQGRIERRRGAGSFVLPPPLHRQEAVLKSFTDDMRERGMTPSSRLLRAEVGTSPDDATALGLAPTAWVVTIERVRCADGQPIALEKAVLPGEFSAVLDADLESGSLHHALALLGRRLGRASGVVTARLASSEEAALMERTTPVALLVETRVVTDEGGRPVERTQTAYVGSRWVIDTGSFVARVGPDAASRDATSER